MENNLKKQNELAAQKKRKMKRVAKRAALWLLAATAVGGGIFGLIKLGATGVSSITSATLAEPVSANDWSGGNKDAKVVLLEYSDFQCPACAAYYPIVKEAMKKYEDKILFVYRYFPLPQHEQGQLSAAAGEAAGRQGRFWEMHNRLFENQSIWSGNSNAEQLITGYARDLGLNESKFVADLHSGEVADVVNKSIDGGVRSGVNSTPSFFLNGKKLNLQNFGDLEYDIKEAINNIK